ncbi:hypothetical protein H6778_02980 [Candidatus Nomurabacteria bacterium]|uniref:asparagine synthase (glutamine-hydrolyzing) n=1 Tax=candidate division WWE3 bacterium TaxID=2053526 RepID=A0A955LVD1_UNCKA|nr:hypothetical protein [candidate division WWE3 bacterium]MCB9812594.1 hypothetical protein [Candidatus Nomurabacteria bacterium]
MGYLIEISSDNTVKIETDFEYLRKGSCTLYYQGLNKNVAQNVIKAYVADNLTSYLNEGDFDNFVFFIKNEEKGRFAIYNDHFGSKEIFYKKDKDRNCVFVTDSVFTLPKEMLNISTQNLYEFFVFQNVLPPDTVYDGISCLPGGSYLSICEDKIEIVEYWDMDSLLNGKLESYPELIKLGDEALKESLTKNCGDSVAVALSGGVDSGGLLGMCVSKLKIKPITISVGGKGPQTIDLLSARKSAKYHNVEQHELYPSFDDMKDMWGNSVGLSQPVQAAASFAYSLINKKAEQAQADTVVYGFGAEMVLGNGMKLSKIANQLRYEKYIPDPILRVLYKIIGSMVAGSENRRRFLLASNDWVSRFMIVRSAYYPWTKKYMTKESSAFMNHVRDKVAVQFSDNLSIYDALVRLYVKSWVNYMQYRDMNAIARRYKVKPVIPFDSLRLVKVFFRLPVKHRKRNNWNKQLIRDIFKPYTPEHLYDNIARSIGVPYTEIFGAHFEEVLHYVEGSTLLSSLYDFNLLKKHLKHEPEPGFFLMFLFGVAVWYDANFYPERELEFQRLFDSN